MSIFDQNVDFLTKMSIFVHNFQFQNINFIVQNFFVTALKMNREFENFAQ